MGLAAPSPIPWAEPREGRPLGRPSGPRGTGGHSPPFRKGFDFLAHWQAHCNWHHSKCPSILKFSGPHYASFFAAMTGTTC